MEVVAKAALWPAVNQKRNGVFPALLESSRSDDVTVNGGAVSASERKLLVVAHLYILELLRREVSQLPCLRTVVRDHVDFARRFQIVFSEHNTLWTTIDRADVTITDHFDNLAIANINAPQRLIPNVLCVRIQS